MCRLVVLFSLFVCGPHGSSSFAVRPMFVATMLVHLWCFVLWFAFILSSVYIGLWSAGTLCDLRFARLSLWFSSLAKCPRWPATFVPCWLSLMLFSDIIACYCIYRVHTLLPLCPGVLVLLLWWALLFLGADPEFHRIWVLFFLLFMSCLCADVGCFGSWYFSPCSFAANLDCWIADVFAKFVFYMSALPGMCIPGSAMLFLFHTHSVCFCSCYCCGVYQ